MRTKLSKTKNKIIYVAKLLFAEISVYKATMNDIANAAQMSRRTLYMHFKSKEEIYQYVIEDQVNSINGKLQKAADSALPPDRKLKLYILARFNVIDNLVKQNKYIRYDFIFNNLRVEQLRKGIDMKERQLLTQIIRDGKEKNIFNINDPASFAKTLLIMFKSLEQPFIMISHRKRNYQSLTEYVDLLFNGILNKS
ncbi:MAG: TetR/AcrR family transcriptional regulator [Odoribacter sp.]